MSNLTTTVTIPDDFDAKDFMKKFLKKRGYKSNRGNSECHSIYVTKTKSGRFSTFYRQAGGAKRVSAGTYDTEQAANEAGQAFLDDLEAMAANNVAQPTPVKPIPLTTLQLIEQLKARKNGDK